jgi:hypothetical protein
MSAEDYNAIHEFFVKLDKVNFQEQKIDPEEDIKDKLLLHFPKKESKIKVLITAKIPAYVAMAAALLAFCLTFSFNSPKLIIKEIHDTIQTVRYVKMPEKSINEINDREVVQQEKEKNFKNSDNSKQYLKKTRENMQVLNPVVNYQRQLALANIKKALSEKKGTNMRDDSALLTLLVRSY